jgi:phosphocarrier protein
MPARPTAQTARVVVCNERGLHARASARFVQCAEMFASEVTVTRDGESVSGTSIMGLMMLAAGPGAEIEIAATGEDAADALKALRALVECGFDE